MQRRAWILGAAIAILAGLTGTPVARASTRLALAPGDRAPQIALPPLHGQPDALYQHQWSSHPLTLVNFWATWCVPCKREMPALQGLSQQHRRRGLTVIGILLEHPDLGEVERFVSDLGIRYTILLGDVETMQAWGGIGIYPTTFLVNREGRIVRRYVGSSPDGIRGLAADVDAVLDGRPLGSMLLPPPPEPAPGDRR